MTIQTYYFTFGQKYWHEKHPQGGHPDGWFAVEAEQSEAAREKMFALCGPKWGFQYDSPPDPDMYPLGELRRIK